MTNIIHGVLTIAMLAAIIGSIVSEINRNNKKKAAARKTETTTAIVTSLHRISRTKYNAICEFELDDNSEQHEQDSEQNESNVKTESKPKTITVAIPFNSEYTNVYENEEIEIHYDPLDPHMTYSPDLEPPQVPTLSGHIASHALRLLILAELLLLNKLI